MERLSKQQKAVSCLQRCPIEGYLDYFSLVLPLSLATYLTKVLTTSLPPSLSFFFVVAAVLVVSTFA